jgi:serine/threonine protein kinase/Flp pilus assembly protein TadD
VATVLNRTVRWAPDVTIPSGKKLGRYEVCSKLGAGGMGEVYLAQDTKLDRKVALKILPAELALNRDRMERFDREAKSAAALNHPNIAQIFEIGEDDGSHFIVMEFIDGVTLREKLHREKTELLKLMRYLQHVAEGLAKAHAAGIVHRDLKPDNIMITRDGHAKILDFGLVKLLEPRLAETATDDNQEEAATAILQQQSTPGVIMGTVGYMSPEQAQGKTNEIDQRSDIFSFGCILYEAVAGQRAFAGKDVIESLNKIIREPVAPISDFRPDAPNHLQRIVRRCLAKDPEDRYQTIKDVAIELRDLRHELAADGTEVSTTVPPAQSETATASGVKGASLESSGSSSHSARTSGAEYVVTGIKQHKFAVAVVLLVAVAAAVGVAGYLFLPRKAKAAIQSIAVLPFENGSGKTDLDYLSDGVSESVIDRLSQLPQLKVIARSSSFRYRGQNLNLKEISDALQVQAIVTGRVVQRGDSYQIRIEMIDARENQNLWSETFNLNASDIQSVQTDISRLIAENLRLRLSGTQTQQLATQPTNPQAYELVLKGRFYSNKGGTENQKKAIEYFQQAIAVYPNCALAYAGLADAYRFLGGDPKEWLPKREAEVRRALELDENLAEAHFSMGQYQRDLWQWQEAEREYKRAMQLNPNYAHAHSGLSGLLSLLGRHDEAIAEDRRARELDPAGVIINTVVGRTLHYARRYDEAIEHLKKTIELDQTSPSAHIRLGDVYVTKRLYREAVAEYHMAIKLGDASNEVQTRLGAAYAKMGERERALDILKGLQTSDRYVSAGQLAILYAALGEGEQAFASLERAYTDHTPSLQFLKVDPAFDSLRSDPRFADLIRRVGLPQ